MTEDANEPVPVTLKGKMAAKKAVISVLSNADLDVYKRQFQTVS